MDINELLDEVKKKLGITSDYRLSKMTGITEKDLSNYRRGITVPDVYACFKFAEILEISPSVMLARVQAHFNKNEAKRLYFKGFFSMLGLWITLGLILPNYSTSIGNVYATGNEGKTLIYIHKSTLCENINFDCFCYRPCIDTRMQCQTQEFLALKFNLVTY